MSEVNRIKTCSVCGKPFHGWSCSDLPAPPNPFDYYNRGFNEALEQVAKWHESRDDRFAQFRRSADEAAHVRSMKKP